MIARAIAKAGATLLVALTLSGCMDVNVAVDVLGPTTARATTISTVGAEVYGMFTMAESGQDELTDNLRFCAQGWLSKKADGSAVCTSVEEGRFAMLTFGGWDAKPSFTREGRDLVRIALSVADLKAEINSEGTDRANPDKRATLEAMLAGRNFTLTFAGAAVLDTNMTLSEDGRSASVTIKLLDVLRDGLKVDDELYALVRAP